jgi:hypothetical protein
LEILSMDFLVALASIVGIDLVRCAGDNAIGIAARRVRAGSAATLCGGDLRCSVAGDAISKRYRIPAAIGASG